MTFLTEEGGREVRSHGGKRGRDEKMSVGGDSGIFLQELKKKDSRRLHVKQKKAAVASLNKE